MQARAWGEGRGGPGGLIDFIKHGAISGKIAKDVFALMFEDEETGDPAEIVDKRGLTQVTDAGAIEKVVGAIIAANPKQVEQVKEKPKTVGRFVGQVMKGKRTRRRRTRF